MISLGHIACTVWSACSGRIPFNKGERPRGHSRRRFYNQAQNSNHKGRSNGACTSNSTRSNVVLIVSKRCMVVVIVRTIFLSELSNLFKDKTYESPIKRYNLSLVRLVYCHWVVMRIRTHYHCDIVIAIVIVIHIVSLYCMYIHVYVYMRIILRRFFTITIKPEYDACKV